MFLNPCRISLLMLIFLFPRESEMAAPSFTETPPGRIEVLQGESVTLTWRYNLNGDHMWTVLYKLGVEDEVVIVHRQNMEQANINYQFTSRVTATLTDTFSSITFLQVDRLADENTYTFEVENQNLEAASTSVTMVVMDKPDNVQLTTTAAANKTCQNDVVNFNCSAVVANPPVTSYQLIKNEVAQENSSSGIWNETLSSSGVFTYKCVANNNLGTANSTSVSITVDVPPTIQAIQGDQVLTEGGNLSLTCQASGTSPLTVYWIKASSGQRTDGSVLQFTNINRNETGEYRCEASNECGNATQTANIDVQSAAPASAKGNKAGVIHGPVIGILAVISVSVMVYFT